MRKWQTTQRFGGGYKSKSVAHTEEFQKIVKNLYLCEEVKNEKRIEFFLSLYVWHHHFLANHSILIILGAQKSRDRPISNESKHINFLRGKIFLRA